MDKEYFFSSLDEVVSFLFNLKENISPIKLQKSLYFLFAYYGATYGSVNKAEIEEEKVEVDKTYPKYLFPAKFEAWKYGPVIREVYSKNKAKEYFGSKPAEDLDVDVIKYLEELFEQMDKVSDFTLVERSHMDKSWKDAFEEGDEFSDEIIDNDKIIEEYLSEYV